MYVHKVLHYTFAAVCGRNVITDIIPQNFSTPFYPRPYRNGLSCEWIINTFFVNQTILVVFFNIETEECCDHIRVSIILIRVFKEKYPKLQL